jgi:pimeloyl-ACP methyl ester carboxylesterase
MKLIFSHGNSFPAGTYEPLLQAWRDAGYAVSALATLGHNERFPVTNNWPHLREELVEHLRSQGVSPQAPALLVGHSLGGVLSVMVASKHPEWVGALVLLDSPILLGWRAHSLHMLKLTGMVARVSPGKISAHRRYLWPNRGAALAHFQGKPAFARWHPEVLQAYIQHGMMPTGRGEEVTLAFRREVETRIYNTLPHQLGSVLKRHPLQCPVAFLGGRQSQELRHTGPHHAKALARGHFEWVEGTHLFPMEHPHRTANDVLRVLAELGLRP